jgi:hypothetical protein
MMKKKKKKNLTNTSLISASIKAFVRISGDGKMNDLHLRRNIKGKLLDISISVYLVNVKI